MSANRNSVEWMCVSSVGCGSLLRSHTYAYDGFGDGIVTTEYAEITEGVEPSDHYAQISVSSAHAVVIHSYDAFGNLLTTENSQLATLLSLRFSTKYLDPETGFYYYGYRYYDPELGRWLTRDPIEEQGGLNLYGFCGNDAVNRWDKLGLKRKTVPWIIAYYLEGKFTLVSSNPFDYFKWRDKIVRGIFTIADIKNRINEALLQPRGRKDLWTQDVPDCYVYKDMKVGTLELDPDKPLYLDTDVFGGSFFEVRFRFRRLNEMIYGPPIVHSGK